MDQDGLDVFASAETIDAEISASAGVVGGGEIADLDAVSLAAGGVDLKVGEDGVRRGKVDNAGLFLAGAGAAAVDLVGIGGAPISERRKRVGGGAGGGIAAWRHDAEQGTVSGAGGQGATRQMKRKD